MPVIFEMHADGIGVVTLSRPSHLNALGRLEFGELGEVLRSPQARGLNGLVVRGADRGFSAGADLTYLAELNAMDTDQRVKELRVGFDSVCELIRFPAPTTALVHGASFGMAACIALACDRIITTSSAKWGFVFTAMGLPATDIACHWLLSRRIGTRSAWSLLAKASTLAGTQAHAAGIVDDCAEDLPLLTDLEWPGSEPNALAVTKESILRLEGAYADLDEEIEQILPVLAAAVGSEFFRERLTVKR